MGPPVAWGTPLGTRGGQVIRPLDTPGHEGRPYDKAAGGHPCGLGEGQMEQADAHDIQLGQAHRCALYCRFGCKGSGVPSTTYRTERGAFEGCWVLVALGGAPGGLGRTKGVAGRREFPVVERGSSTVLGPWGSSSGEGPSLAVWGEDRTSWGNLWACA